MLLLPTLQRKLSNITELTPAQAVILINRQSPLVLDVREEAEFAAGHIAEARNIPLAALNSRLAEIEAWKDQPLLVNCKAGGRSTQACALLHGQGFTKLHNLQGGLTAWQTANLPVVKE